MAGTETEDEGVHEVENEHQEVTEDATTRSGRETSREWAGGQYGKRGEMVLHSVL